MGAGSEARRAASVCAGRGPGERSARRRPLGPGLQLARPPHSLGRALTSPPKASFVPFAEAAEVLSEDIGRFFSPPHPSFLIFHLYWLLLLLLFLTRRTEEGKRCKRHFPRCKWCTMLSRCQISAEKLPRDCSFLGPGRWLFSSIYLAQRIHLISHH